jgi:PAS domain S-box-containing protein
MSQNGTQLKYIQDFLIELAQGNFSSRLDFNNDDDEQSQSVKAGINMLVEELSATTTSKIFLNSIYDGINDILIVLDSDGNIQKTNRVVDSMLSYPETELLNKPIDTLIHSSDIDLVKNCIRNAYNLSELQEVGVNFITKENVIIPVSCSISVLQNNKNERSGVLLVAKNISALLNTRDQLQAKNDELNLFVYKASHDLKSPVTSMMGLIGLINKSNSLEEIKNYCRMVEKCTEKLDSVLNELLVLGHITYGELEFSTVNVKEIIDEILSSIQFVDNFNLVEKTITIHDNISGIVTEKGLLKTVLFNLIDNGIKYYNPKAEKPFLKVDIKATADGILIVVEDNGQGIQKEFQPNIFKMFYRANYVSKGSGLGLYIVKTSVAKLAGSILFESEHMQGCRFEIRIPCKVIKQ